MPAPVGYQFDVPVPMSYTTYRSQDKPSLPTYAHDLEHRLVTPAMARQLRMHSTHLTQSTRAAY